MQMYRSVMGSGLLDNKSIGLLDLGGKINKNER